MIIEKTPLGGGYVVPPHRFADAALAGMLVRECPASVMHFAAEIHGNWSIVVPAEFNSTRVLGTLNRLFDRSGIGQRAGTL